MLPLIDGDWIVFMACQAIEYSWEGEDSPPFEDIINVYESRIQEIKNALDTKETPILFFSGANNFRKEIAKTKVYKGNRTTEKPYHYYNLKNYVEARYPTEERDDIEADDLMAIYQSIREKNIEKDGLGRCPSCIVSPDKDLRQVEGWNYGPEGHNYGSFGPVYITKDNSYIELKGKKVVGTGWKFFYAQLLTGDTVDNIPGCPGKGPVAAYNLLANTTTEGEAFEAVREAYRDTVLLADECMEEQAHLLFMIREVKEDESLIHWTPPIMGESERDGNEDS